MSDAEIWIQVAEDRESVAVELRAEGGPSSPVVLDLDELTELIGVLGEARHRMTQGRATRSLEGQTIRTVTDPSWYVQVAKIDGSLLAFDHPAFGPVGFAIPRQDVAEIVRLLNVHLSFPSSQRSRTS